MRSESRPCARFLNLPSAPDPWLRACSARKSSTSIRVSRRESSSTGLRSAGRYTSRSRSSPSIVPIGGPARTRPKTRSSDRLQLGAGLPARCSALPSAPSVAGSSLNAYAILTARGGAPKTAASIETPCGKRWRWACTIASLIVVFPEELAPITRLKEPVNSHVNGRSAAARYPCMSTLRRNITSVFAALRFIPRTTRNLLEIVNRPSQAQAELVAQRNETRHASPWVGCRGTKLAASLRLHWMPIITPDLRWA